MASTLMDLLFPDSAERAGTQRVERIEDQNLVEQSRPTIKSVLESLLGTAETIVTQAISETSIGQRAIEAEKQRQIQSNIGWALLIVLVLVLATGFLARRV